MRVQGHHTTDTRNVLFEAFFFRSELARPCCVAGGQFLADGDFLFIGEAREAHGNTREIALGVRGHIQNSVGRDRWGLGAALAPVETRERKVQDENESDENNGALHRYWRIASRYLL